MNDKLVLVLLGHGANDAVRGLMLQFGSALEAIGVPVMNVALEPAELQLAVDEMSRGNVHFALTWLGAGQEMAGEFGTARELRNVWEAFNVPLVKIHADSPAYFSDRHRDLPRTSVNLYMAEEFAHFRRRFMPAARSIAALVPPWPMSPIERSRVDLGTRRRGTLVFLKNGNAPSDLRVAWDRELSPSMARLLREMAEAIVPPGTRPGVLHVGDFVADWLAAHQRIDPDSALSMMPFLTAQLDDYLRRVKSEMIAKALLDFPVIVQGAYWDHVDFSGRRARLVPGQDFELSHRIFTDQLGVIDMSPNMDSEPHERMMRAAGSYALALTNVQSWLARDFPECGNMMFEFSPESIASRIDDALAHPDRYLEMGMAFGERFREVYPRDGFARRVLEVASLAETAFAEPKPQPQNFFIWPARHA